MTPFNANSLRVKYSYTMAREIALASAAIKQRHYEQQQTNPAYWDEDRAAIEADGVVPDERTGVAVPVIRYAVPAMEYERGEPDTEAFNRAEQEKRDEQAAQEKAEAERVEREGAGLWDMVKAAPKAMAALVTPDSPMAQERLAICKGCENWTGSKCRKCGCFTALKVRLPSESCPIGKWSAVS